jgi:hypothetical protein
MSRRGKWREGEERWENIIRKRLRKIGKQANGLRRVILQAKDFISGLE